MNPLYLSRVSGKETVRLFPWRRRWDRFREGGSEKVSGFGIIFLAFLNLFFSGKPEMWGTRDKSLQWCVRLLRTCCSFAVAVDGRCERRLEGRDENSGQDFSSKWRRWVLRSANIHDRRCLLVLSVDESGVGEKKSTWVWCATCLAQLYGARLYTLWYSTWRWVFSSSFESCLAWHCVVQSNAYYRSLNTYIWFFQCV